MLFFIADKMTGISIHTMIGVERGDCIMKTKLISKTRNDFEQQLNQALEELSDNEIIDIKFTQGNGLNGAVVVSALILYK